MNQRLLILFFSSDRNPNIKYAEIICKIYDEEIDALIYPVINNACKYKIKHFDSENPLDGENDRSADITMLTALYQSYRLLFDFLQTVKLSFPTIIDDLKLKKFHVWFENKDVQMVEIAIFKAYIQIRNAIEKDTLQPYDEFVKFSSSAVDTLTIFKKTIVYWKTFSWPDVKSRLLLLLNLLRTLTSVADFTPRIFLTV